jgi:hypothetical protein
MSQLHKIAVVQDQFTAIRQQLAVQLTRTAEIQQQMDLQRKEIVNLTRQLEEAQELVTALVQSGP